MNKDKRVSVRLSDKDYELIKANAHRVHMTVSAFIRSMAVKGINTIVCDPEIRSSVREILMRTRETSFYLQELSGLPEKGDLKASRAIELSREQLKKLTEGLAPIIEGLNRLMKGE